MRSARKKLLAAIAERRKDFLPPPYDAILDEAGFDGLCSIVDHFGGLTVYIPGSVERIMKDCLRAEMLESFDGTNYDALAKRFEMTRRQVRKLLHDS